MAEAAYKLGSVTPAGGEAPAPAASVDLVPTEWPGAIRGMWMTPGAYMATRLPRRPEILLLAEKVDTDRHRVFVVVESDPVDLLDRVFEIEAEIYERFPELPFDVRVLVLQPGMNAEDLEAGAVAYYKRP